MSTDAIGSYGYSSAYTKLRESAEQEKLYAMAAQAEKKAEAEGSTGVAADLMNYLSKIPKGDDGKLSFKDVDDYRQKLETEWDLEVMADLDKLGVNIDQQFPLTYDPATGKVTVSGDHPDKAVVDKYFEDNPDKVKTFEEIVQLGKLTTVANSELSQTEMLTNLRQESLAWWYEDNSDPTSWFDGGGMLVGQGQAAYKGLNIKV